MLYDAFSNITFHLTQIFLCQGHSWHSQYNTYNLRFSMYRIISAKYTKYA